MCSGASYFLNLMKPRTRDNLIYLAVGLGVAALWASYFFYADSHGSKMWVPSRFTSRTFYTTLLIWYVVFKSARQTRPVLVRVVASMLFATFLHLIIFFGCRQVIDQLPTLMFWLFWVIELYLVIYATEKSVELVSSPR